MDECELIPGLPHEIAMTCLVRLPRRIRAIASSVSRAWLNALKDNSSVKSLRLSLNLPPQHWIFISIFESKCNGDYEHATQHNSQWLLLDPVTLQTLVLPNPLVAGVFKYIHLFGAATDNNLFLPEVDGFCSYNMQGGGGGWQSLRLPSGQRCRRFGCAEMNEFFYVSGRLLDLTRKASRSAYRYDSRTNQWETLPNMILPRVNCAGVAWNGKFFAIGGCYHSTGGLMEVHTSGECFDPETGEWTLLPNLCANGLRYAENSHVTEAVFAEVEGKLYAMQPHSNEIMQLSEQRQWTHFAYVGSEDCEMRMVRYGINYKLVAVGGELWAIMYEKGKSMQMYSCNTGEVSKGRKWKQIEISGMEQYDHVLTCTILSV